MLGSHVRLVVTNTIRSPQEWRVRIIISWPAKTPGFSEDGCILEDCSTRASRHDQIHGRSNSVGMFVVVKYAISALLFHLLCYRRQALQQLLLDLLAVHVFDRFTRSHLHVHVASCVSWLSLSTSGSASSALSASLMGPCIMTSPARILVCLLSYHARLRPRCPLLRGR